MANPNERHSIKENGTQKSEDMVKDPAHNGSKQHQQESDLNKKPQDQRDRAKPQHGDVQDRGRQQR